MRLPLIILFLVVLLNLSPEVIQAESDSSVKEDSLILQDPFKNKKSDTGIKPLVFPQSIEVVQACSNLNCLAHNPILNPPVDILGHDSPPPQWLNSYHPRYHENLVGVSPEFMDKVFSDQTWAKRTLLEFDPERLTPVSLGRNWSAPFDGFIYLGLCSGRNCEYEKKFIYERENNNLKKDLILFYKVTFNHRDPEANILTEGRIYLVHQKKILVVPDNRQRVPFKHASIEYDGKEYKEKINVPPDVLANMKKIMKEAHTKGIRRLAYDTRKALMSHKYKKLTIR